MEPRTYDVQGCTPEQEEALPFLARALGVAFGGGGTPVRVAAGGEGLALRRGEDGWELALARPGFLARALGLLAENAEKPRGFCLAEAPRYDELGVMLDCSRNAVPNRAAFEEITIRLALMGYNEIQLYMEDTFELEGYPYWGYLRGRYTQEDLRGMDRFASLFGIELVPAVQTLAHLGQALKWAAFAEVRDTRDILLIDEEKTYRLIDAIFKTLAACFKTRRVNIGMDEAHAVGFGNYFDLHGSGDRTELMLRHFGRVAELARAHGFSFMMWSDMFFRLASGGEYYALDCEISETVAQSLPGDLTLIYWDYYSDDKKRYDRMLQKHGQLTKNLLFAGGAWKWSGFSPNNRFSMRVSEAAHQSCVENGMRRLLVTAWGDDGAECSLFAILPSLQFWAELCWGEAHDDAAMRGRFAACCNADWDSFLLLDEPMLTPGNPAPGRCAVNAPKYLLYQDILSGIFDAHIEKGVHSAHFARCAGLFRAALARRSEWDFLFETQLALCEALALKCRAGLELREAYGAGDRAALSYWAQDGLPRLLALLERFVSVYHAQWERENRAPGLDVFDIKLGALLQRVKTANDRLLRYLDGSLPAIEELEQTLLPYDGIHREGASRDISAAAWENIVTASSLRSL